MWHKNLVMISRKLSEWRPWSSKPRRRSNQYFLPQGICGIRFDETCYFLIVGKMNYKDAKTRCSQIEGKLANIWSRGHYNAMIAYMRKQIPKSMKYIEVWTAMTLMISTGKVRLSNFSQATFLQWYPGQPTRDFSRRYIYLHIPKIKSTKQGMVNYSPASKLTGALCEIPQRSSTRKPGRRPGWFLINQPTRHYIVTSGCVKKTVIDMLKIPT